MNNGEIASWLESIYATLHRLEMQVTPNNVKTLSAIYYEIERVRNILLQEGGNDEQ